jgi:hypothetical protein
LSLDCESKAELTQQTQRISAARLVQAQRGNELSFD